MKILNFYKRFEGIVKLGKVNCQEEQALCQHAGITGYPSIMFYSKNYANTANSVGEFFLRNQFFNFFLFNYI